MSDYKKTVDLSQKMPETNGQSFNAPKKRIAKKIAKKLQPIDKVFEDNEMHKIDRPVRSADDNGFYKKLSLILIIFLFASFYFVFFKKERVNNDVQVIESQSGWYAVELMNGETYYGEIKDTGADPIIIENVYYNYDQINSENGVKSESANLRLVKRGKETHGPDGTMSVVRSQVVFMEPLKEDSKVLKAILDYEK